jgi:UDP-3-O-[3-hydroxymyristoyl] glucosamine N-acyltransferase LpxD
LIAPKQILNNSELCQQLVQKNTLILMSENPRLMFIKALVNIEKSAGIAGSSFIRNVGVVKQGVGCVIKSGAIVGQAGFGFERDLDGTPIRFPHFGSVILGNNVEIGSNSVVSRGAITDTRIDDDTKIDDLVYIAHNCKIGSKVMIAGNATLCGGVQVGDGAWIGAGASIRQNISVGAGATVGMGAVVVKDVPAGVTVMGNPAVEGVKMESARCAV